MTQKQIKKEKEEETIEIPKKQYQEIMEMYEEFLKKVKELKTKKEIEEARKQKDIPHEKAMKQIGLE